MGFKYNKDSLKENLSIEEVFDLVAEMGGEPKMGNDVFTAKTICHCGSSHKLYYYGNTHLFHCYTECGDSFDIYELILKIKNLAGQTITLAQSVSFIAKYFGYNSENFDFDELQENLEDWKIINTFQKNKEKISPQIVELKHYNDKILQHFPQPHIIPWEDEGIAFSIIKSRKICYNPINMGIIIPHYDIDNNLIGIRERTLIKEEEIFGKYKPAIIKGQMYNHPLGFNLYNLNNSKKNIKLFHKAIVFEGKRQSRPSPLFYVTAQGYI